MEPRTRGRGVSWHVWHWPALVAVVAGGILLAGAHPPLNALPSSVARGMAIRYKDERLQERATHVKPSPPEAGADKPRPISEGCMIGITGTRSSTCLYGDAKGKRIVVLFGDSHALQDFPALQALAKRDGWRLFVLTQRECTPAEVTIRNEVEHRRYSACDAWRQRVLERLEKSGGSTTVALSEDTTYTAYGPAGEELSGRANAKALEAGDIATLRRIERSGLRPGGHPRHAESRTNEPSCVSEHMHELRDCSFRDVQRWSHSFDLRAAERVPGTRLIDVNHEICPSGLCRAVIGNVIVFRDNQHLTATYDRTLSPWVEPGLKKAVLSSPAGGSQSGQTERLARGSPRGHTPQPQGLGPSHPV